MSVVIAVTVVAGWAPFVQKAGPGDISGGQVGITTHIYFEKKDANGLPLKDQQGNILTQDASLAQLPGGMGDKQGVYSVNISDDTRADYISNLRIDIYVYSSVDTYVRIRLAEQIALTIGDKTELSIVDIHPYSYMYTKYLPATGGGQEQQHGWHYAGIPGYYYYTQTVRRLQTVVDGNVTTAPYKLSFLNQDMEFMPLTAGDYSMQLSVIVDAVQAHKGMRENWGFTTPPWMV